jgi:hypothetical protein
MQPESRSSKLNSCTMGTQNGAKRIKPDVSAYTMGRGTAAETQLMVTEKMLALVEAVGTVAMGGSAHKVARDYRKRVRANVRRLGQ